MHWSNLFRYFVLDDYLKLAIQWLPPVGFSYFIAYLITEIETLFKATPEVPEKAKSPSRIKFFLASAMILIFFGTPVLLCIFYIIGYKSIRLQDLYNFSVFPIALLLIYFYKVYEQKAKLRIEKPFPNFGLFIFGGLFLMILATYNGLSTAEQVKDGMRQPPRVRITLAEPSPPMQGQIIFILDKYVLILKQNETTLSAIPSTIIRFIEELPETKKVGRKGARKGEE